MGCPIPKPVLSTEPEPLHHWGYQLTLMLYNGKGGFRPLGNICKGDLGEAGHVAQLAECLLSTHEALGSGSTAAESGVWWYTLVIPALWG